MAISFWQLHLYSSINFFFNNTWCEWKLLCNNNEIMGSYC